MGWSKKWKGPSGEGYKHKERPDGTRELLVFEEGGGADHEHHVLDEHGNLKYSRGLGGRVVANDEHQERSGDMSIKESSRGDLEKGKEKTQQHMEGEHKKLEQDIKDKKIVSETASKARVEGTTEGMDKVKKNVESSGKEIDEKAKKDHGELKGVHKKEAAPREKSLAERRKKTEADKKDIMSAFSRVETKGAKKELKHGAEAAQEDAKYMEGQRRDQEKRRKTSEKKGQKQEATVQATRVKFRK